MKNKMTDPVTGIVITDKKLLHLIRFVAVARSNCDKREPLKYLNVCEGLNGKVMVATDGMRLHLCKLDNLGCEIDFGLYSVEIINSKRCLLLKSQQDLVYASWESVVPVFVKERVKNIHWKSLENSLDVGQLLCRLGKESFVGFDTSFIEQLANCKMGECEIMFDNNNAPILMSFVDGSCLVVIMPLLPPKQTR